MNLLSDRLLVKPLPKEANETASGIILGTKPKNINDFEVILTGPEVRFAKPGDIVRKFKNISGIAIEHDGIDCLLLREGSEIEFLNP